MTSKHFAIISTLAAVGTLLLAWRNRPLVAHPLVYAPFDPSTADLTNYGPQWNADAPSTAQINATDANSATFGRYREPGIVSTYLPRVFARTWGVPVTPIASPSALPDLGIVKGQAPQNSDLLDAARAKDEASPSVTPDADLYDDSYDPTLYENDVM